MALVNNNCTIKVIINNNILYSDKSILGLHLAARFNLKFLSKEKALEIINIYHPDDNNILDIDDESMFPLPQNSLITKKEGLYIYAVPDELLN